MSRATSPWQSQALARHEVIDLARAAAILMLTVAAALFVPRSLFASTPAPTPTLQAYAQPGE